MFLGLASPLFLCAPAAMRRTNIIAFYIVALSPALMVLILKAYLLNLAPMPHTQRPEDLGRSLLPFTILLPVIRWRQPLAEMGHPLIFGIAGLALVLSGLTPAAWTAALLSLVAVQANQDKGAQIAQMISVVLFALVLCVDEAQL